MTFGFSASFVWVAVAAAVAAAALGKEQAAAKKNRTRQEIPEMSVFAATIFDQSLSIYLCILLETATAAQ